MSTVAELAVTLAGWTGALATVVAYGMVTAKRIDSDSLLFQGLNIVGAGLLSISASTYGAWPSAIVNVIWVAIGLVALRAILAHRAATVVVPLLDEASMGQAQLENGLTVQHELETLLEAAAVTEAEAVIEAAAYQTSPEHALAPERNSAPQAPVAA